MTPDDGPRVVEDAPGLIDIENAVVGNQGHGRNQVNPQQQAQAREDAQVQEVRLPPSIALHHWHSPKNTRA
jgi:hypothetical protein